ncbi:acetyl-CoA C-acetyltransferase [Desulfotomaculum arcticum]|uniref:Acetyl-CoA C-acetyltransferase n=1 Tax=Desulfotruncus arcticus DSM 17038 TaxID=1121424 RepID=A0A1I2U2N1_9FIRM|nr:acetyl-CoA acetyltransferase [Desulfotruncus arcticus]SFG71388.1 acetyl-CoA C-acetyltransferase [Desulfotomaculum arcticum] [Desulfotruncus arcticus DSM 17038]
MSIRDKVAIIGMGCIRFGEHWDKGINDMLVEAAYEAYNDAGLSPDDIQAYWLGTCASGWAGISLSEPLKIQYKPVTRVENFCATGTDAFRNACYAVASGAYDIAMAIGVEKLKDSGYSGLVITPPPGDGTAPNYSAPAAFSLLAPAYFKKYGLDPETGKKVLARIAYKNHKNGALNPKAQFRQEVPMEKILKSPVVAAPLGVMDCSGVADGSAAAIIVRAEDAHKYRQDPIYVKALSVVCGPGHGAMHQDYDFTSIRETYHAGVDAYRQAGITNPRKEISMAEVHDCFTPTELVIYEDLGFSERGRAWQDVLDGVFDLAGELPVNPDGGLKSFGHPIGASGLRMLYEMYLQLRGQAGPRQIDNPRLGLTHNLGGFPWESVCSVCIVGKEPG